MRVAFTLEQCWHPVPGGTAVAALELARALNERDDVELVGVAARHRNQPPEAWRPPIPIVQVPLPRIVLYETWQYLRWPRVERTTGPVDVVHATGVAMPPRGTPIVLTVHDLAFLDYPELFSRQGLRFFRRQLALSRRDATIVLCSSLATLERCAAAGFDESRLRHVPLGVRATPAPLSAVERARAEYGLDGRYVLWTGTVEPRKNLASLLRAFSLLEGDARLVLVGPAGWNEDLASLVGSLPDGVRGRIHVLGFVPRTDLEALYAGADVFCFPSLLEGFGFPVVEAMAQGTPVVTSRGTSTEELAAGDAGLLVDPREPEEIANALARVLDDAALARRLSEAGLRRAAQYTWAKTADLVVAAYNEAFRRRAS